MAYSSRRQTDHLNDPEATELALAQIAQSFGEGWLDAPADDPIRDLWGRRDALAVNQLVILGSSLIDARRIDRRWADRQVKLMKTDRNNRRGAAFEIFALSMLNAGDRTARPTSASHPGYDALVDFPSGGELAVSFKNYGTSVREREFRAGAARIEATFAAMLASTGRSGEVLLAFADRYPEAADWRSLEVALPDFPARQEGMLRGFWGRPPWLIGLREAPEVMLPLSVTHCSHQVLIGAAFHQNEEKNLTDKLDAAAANARRHAASAGATRHVVLVHVPETFPAQACIDWAEEYLARNPEGPVGLVALHQLAVAEIEGQSALMHMLVAKETSAHVNWRGNDRKLAFNCHVGMPIKKPSRSAIEDAPDVDLDRMYLYQRGEWWRDFGTSVLGNLANPAPGIFQHAVMQIDGCELLIQGRFPPSGSVTLFD